MLNARKRKYKSLVCSSKARFRRELPNNFFFYYNQKKSKADSGIFMQILFLLDQIFTNLHSYLFCLSLNNTRKIFLSSASLCYSFASVPVFSPSSRLLFLDLCKYYGIQYFKICCHLLWK